MSDALFDADEYIKPGMRPRRPATIRKPPPDPAVPIVMAEHWRYMNALQHGIFHAFKARGNGAVVTMCGRSAAARTFTPGEIVPGCVECIAKGAFVEYPR
jgi:hypothetical protein